MCPLKKIIVMNEGVDYPSTLVLGRPIGLRPSSHRPRSLRTFIRSKRFITDFFPLADPEALRLLCFDIIKILLG